MKERNCVTMTLLLLFCLRPLLAKEMYFGNYQIKVTISPGYKIERAKEGQSERIEVVSTASPKKARSVEIVFSAPKAQGLILPIDEGHYVPSKDKDWAQYLCKGWPQAMTEVFSFPAWGYDFQGEVGTILATNQFDNEVFFSHRDDELRIKVKHTFTKLSPKKRIGFLISFADSSLLAPAKAFRHYFFHHSKELTLKEKLYKNPRVKRLFGAPHAYVWGDWILAQDDIKDWKGFSKVLVNSEYPLWEKLSQKGKVELEAITKGGYVYPYRKLVIIEEIDRVLKSPDFLHIWEPAKEISACLRERKLWGAGVSESLLMQLSKDGFKKFALYLGDLDTGVYHPQVAKLADKLGYLYGPYDSYHSVHHPSNKKTWPTAQFDLQAYQKGAMQRADGSFYSGFNKIGRKLNPAFAKPYMKKRVTGLLGKLHYTNWFVDCDAYGELHNDYSPHHPMSKEEDAKLRTERMKWLNDELGLVVASEKGASYAAAGIHVAHGMLTPVFGFRDPDMRTKGKPHYLGAYWPKDGPQIMIKQVPLKPYYYKFIYDPRFRLPLYQAAFHDCVIATHHWGYSTLKFKETVVINELLELLYNVPPLYHLNKNTYKKHGKRMRSHCSVFSFLHERLALQEMTSFSWLTDDRLAQQTVFGDGTKLIANFGDKAFPRNGRLIPAKSFIALAPNGKVLVAHSPLPR